MDLVWPEFALEISSPSAPFAFVQYLEPIDGFNALFDRIESTVNGDRAGLWMVDCEFNVEGLVHRHSAGIVYSSVCRFGMRTKRNQSWHCQIVVTLVISLCLLYSGFTVRGQDLGTWQLLLPNAGIAAMHTALTRYGTLVMIDRTDIGASQINLPRE